MWKILWKIMWKILCEKSYVKNQQKKSYVKNLMKNLMWKILCEKSYHLQQSYIRKCLIVLQNTSFAAIVELGTYVRSYAICCIESQLCITSHIPGVPHWVQKLKLVANKVFTWYSCDSLNFSSSIWIADLSLHCMIIRKCIINWCKPMKFFYVSCYW